jgi:hypothetical protein
MFGDGLKLMEFIASGYGTMAALGILLADGNGRGSGDLNSDNPIVGSWAGDPIVIAGDYADEGKFLSDTMKDRTLYQVADNDGEDISHLVLEALLDDTHFAGEFLKGWNKTVVKNSYYAKVNAVIDKHKNKSGAPQVPLANHHFVIGSKGDTYTVIDINDGSGEWVCSCPAYTYNKVPGTDCKHIKEVKTKLKTT